MSNVPKSERLKSPAEFLVISRKLKIMTVQKCTHIPKRLWPGLGAPLIDQVTKAKSSIVFANSIFPENRTEAILRRNALKTARANLYSVASDIDDLLEIRNEIGISYESVDDWIKLTYRLIMLLERLIESDAKRYKNLSDS